MSIPEWAILLFVAGVALVVAEVLLPTHGILGVLGAGGIVGGIVMCFLIHPTLGIGSLVGTAAATPFAWVLFLKLYPLTRVGRQTLLPPVKVEIPPLPVQIGQTGVTVSDLRPMGTCDFGGVRVETLSERGMVPPGTRVQVISLDNRRPVVRPV